MGNKTTWTEIASAAISNKVFLAEIEPAQEVTLWTLTQAQSNTYQKDFFEELITLADGSTETIAKAISKLEEDGTALTEKTNAADVESNAGSFCYISNTSTGAPNIVKNNSFVDIVATNDYTSDYTSDADGTGYSGGTAVGNIDGIAGVDDVLRFTANTGTSTHYVTHTITNVPVGNCVRLRFDYYIPSTNAVIAGLYPFLNSNNVANEGVVLDAWASVDFYDNCVSAGTNLRFYATDGSAGLSLAGANGDVFYIKNIIWDLVDIAEFTDGTGWAPQTASGFLTQNAQKVAGTASDLEQDVAAEADVTYTITYIVYRSAGTLTPQIGGVDGTTISADGTYVDTITTTGTGNLKFQADSSFVGRIDEVSVQEVVRGRIYIHPINSDDPNDYTMLAYFWLYFATQGIELNGKYYEPYISKKGIPSISQSVESIFYGISVISSGDLQLLNHSGYFDQILDKFIWINKKVKLFAGGDDLPYSEYLQIYTGLITSKKYSRRELPFRLKSGLNPLLRDIPINNFWTSNFPNLDPSAEGKPIPYYYGIYSEAQAPIVTCINTAYVGSLLQFQICDHAILSISQVYINFFDGDGWQTISHGNEDLTNARFTISDAGFILGTTQVKVAFSGITDGGIVEKGPYIAEHLLTNFLGYTSSNLNTASFTTSKAESTAQLNVPIENVTSALTIIEKICASDLAFFDEDLDGNFRYRSWAPSIGSSIPVVDDTDFIDDVPEVIFDQKDAYYKINVGYSYMSESRKHLYQEITNNQTLYKYGKNDPLRQDTYIRGADDALVLAQRMAFILEQPSGQLEVSLKMQHMDLLVGDSLKITMARAPFGSASGWVQRVFEISKTEKRCFPVKNNLVLRDLAGYGSSVGFWVASTVPVWGSATQQEKEDSGWWSDANGYVATGEADSYNVSRWW